MRNHEKGSVVGYALGAILLLALLVGGIWLFKNNIGRLSGVNNSNPSDTKVADNNSDSSNQNTTTTTDDQAAKNEAALKQQQEAQNNKDQNTTTQTAPTNNTNTTTNNSGTGTTNGTANTNVTNNQTTNKTPVAQVPHTSTVPDGAAQSGALPKTGPAEDIMMTAAGISTLVGLGFAYARSRAAL